MGNDVSTGDRFNTVEVVRSWVSTLPTFITQHSVLLVMKICRVDLDAQVLSSLWLWALRAFLMMLCIFNIVTIFPLNCYKKWGFWMLTLCPPSYILSSSFHSQVRATITNTSRINVTILPHRIVRALLIPKAFCESRLLC